MVIMSTETSEDHSSSLSPLRSASPSFNDRPKKPPVLKPKPKLTNSINHLVNNVNDIITKECNHNQKSTTATNVDDDILSQSSVNGK